MIKIKPALKTMIIEETIKEVLEQRRLDESKWGWVKFSHILLRLGRNLHRISANALSRVGTGAVLGFRANFFDTLGNSFRKLDNIIDDVLDLSRSMSKTDLVDTANKLLKELDRIETKFKNIADEISVEIQARRAIDPHDPTIGMLDRVEKQMLKNAEDVNDAMSSINPNAPAHELSERLHQLAYATKHGKKTGWFDTQFGGRRAPDTTGTPGPNPGPTPPPAAKGPWHYLKVIGWGFSKWGIGWAVTSYVGGGLMYLMGIKPTWGAWLWRHGPVDMIMLAIDGIEKYEGYREGQAELDDKKSLLTFQGIQRKVYQLVALKIFEQKGGAPEGKSYKNELEALVRKIKRFDEDQIEEEIVPKIKKATKIDPKVENLAKLDQDLFDKLFDASFARVIEATFKVYIPPASGGFYTKKETIRHLKIFLRNKGTSLEDYQGPNAEPVRDYAKEGIRITNKAKGFVIERIFKSVIADLKGLGLQVRSDLLSQIQ